MKSWKTMIALAAVMITSGLLAAQSVSAQEIDFGYEVNSTTSASGKRILQYDGVTMQLTAAANATVDLTADDNAGGLPDFDNALFAMDATAGTTTETLVGTHNVLTTPFSGFFTFTQAGTGALILRVDFTDATLSAREGSRNGALFQSSDDGDLTMTIGSAIPGGLVAALPNGFSFALGGVNQKFNNNTEGGKLASFTAKSSFLADTAVIPEPSGFVLTAVGMFGFAALRRRQK